MASIISAIIFVAIVAIVIWGLVVLLSNPLVQAILVLFALGGFLFLVQKESRK
jgi:hypothetical protein